MIEGNHSVEGDRAYFERRADEELRSASRAVVPQARRAHEELAEIYARRAVRIII